LTETSAVIPASGLGKRLGKHGKTFLEIAGKPLLAHTLLIFEGCADIDEIVLVVRREQISDAEALVGRYGLTKVSAIVPGGRERQDSVRCGLSAVSSTSQIVVIHDAARPFITCQAISDSVAAAREHGAAVVAVPEVDTVKSSLDGAFVESTLQRERLWAVQTPQTFKKEIIEAAFDKAGRDGFTGTDDASLVERMGVPVKIVMGSYQNIKVTTPSDIPIAEAILKERGLDMESAPVYRVGHGYDIHRFSPGRRLLLGGVEFPGQDGLLGHSDADVLLHAVADALLGAAGMGDIGKYFPDSDPAFKDADSMNLLSMAGKVVADKGWKIGNVDVTLVAQRPKLSPHVPQIQQNIARALKISPDQVGVKATTREGLGAIGEGLGIECHSVALIFK
jgi:2-C-methyl-D-erythritol 4-phosphate cytidylyltransferase/2-C-methyl-D-erythritol 2,4-cyclodiphosphate synthase